MEKPDSDRTSYSEHLKFRYKIEDPRSRYRKTVVSGSGEFSHYEEVPNSVAELIKEGKK